MVFIVALYGLVDILQHKGLVRVMISKDFPAYKIDSGFPASTNILINTGKDWVKAIDTKELMVGLDKKTTGLECDVYFDSQKNDFDVHHDESNSIGLNLDNLLQVYKDKGLSASVWLDLKNLKDSNAMPALKELMRLRSKYELTNKILVESKWPERLTPFSDSGFATAYYTPFFNPYLLNNDSLQHLVDDLSTVISRSKVNFLTGYYFQYPFLQYYFPNYPLLIWSPNDKFSIINWWYKKRIRASKAVFISLYP
jgi:hypothetical protein